MFYIFIKYNSSFSLQQTNFLGEIELSAIFPDDSCAKNIGRYKIICAFPVHAKLELQAEIFMF